MNRLTDFVSGMLAGAVVMYLLDPERGRRRRALVRDQLVHGAHEVGDAGERIATRSEDLRNRARGAVAETRARLRSEEVDDAVLEARVRTELGRVVAHPGSIEVTVRDGRVTLAGPVLEHELERLLGRAAAVRGVKGLENQLEVHDRAGSVPGLQGTTH